MEYEPEWQQRYIGLYQAVIDSLIEETENSDEGSPQRKGAVLAAITALKQICNHPLNYRDDGGPIEGRSGKLDRLYELVETVFAAFLFNPKKRHFGDDTEPTGTVSSRKREGCVSECFIRSKEKLSKSTKVCPWASEGRSFLKEKTEIIFKVVFPNFRPLVQKI